MPHRVTHSESYYNTVDKSIEGIAIPIFFNTHQPHTTFYFGKSRFKSCRHTEHESSIYDTQQQQYVRACSIAHGDLFREMLDKIDTVDIIHDGKWIPTEVFESHQTLLIV